MKKLLLLMMALLCSSAMATETIMVAVAGGFKPAMDELAPLFEQEHDVKLQISYGAVGNLYAQIHNGAPFDLLLSADETVPTRLENEGLGVSGSRFTYAWSQLALWSPDPKLVDSDGEVLKKGNFTHLALPNPKVGVHGTAAMAVMAKMGVLPGLTGKLVEGKNVLQTYQQIISGSAELGFISLSLICRNGELPRGSVWLVPETLHPMLAQQAILLKKGQSKPGAGAFLSYLHSEKAQKVISSYGYELK